MPRRPRFSIPGQPQHVIQRGNNREATFASNDDRRQFAAMLTHAANQHGCQIHAYVLMSNHVHLLVTPLANDGIAKMMQSLGRRYVRYFNQRNGRTGTLWEGRYRATLIDSERYLLACMRYIELNPVRAGMVSLPGDYGWSSFAFNAHGNHDALVTLHPQYLALGANGPAQRQAYRALFDTDMERSTADDIRRATNSAWVLGGPDFATAVEAQLDRRVTPQGSGGDRRSARYRTQIKRL